ncbi:hypothetical protein CN514_04190 [Bacillus sp. AFS001701]|uniref:histidine phosphatase family protein n=1 Tax=Bacillus sp. AFS001701 TaxID=2033480 RepID=UPI000BF7E6D0|nr:phosphoglycerate mutase family protein [Bacillus sp. AFS001701]PET75326.1 hypothetical protein CN514_04190 [Bacillus sp. AFS001701]
MKKTFYLMRHGQTLFNKRRKIQGWCDSPLTGDFFVKFGGEDQKELQQRMATTCQKIMEEDNEVVLAVSHGAALRNFMRYWEHKSSITQQDRIGNCCILKFEFQNREFKLIEIINHNFSDVVQV